MDNIHLEFIQVKNYFSIKNITLSGLSQSKEIYFLGENGDGKTLVLQAVLLAFVNSKLNSPNYESFFDTEEVGKIKNCLNANPNFVADYNGDRLYELLKGKDFFYSIFAYGANRNKSTADKGGKDGYGTQGYLTLFDNSRALKSPTQWLKDLKLEGQNATINIENAIKLLEEILDNDVKIKIEGSKVLFFERDTKLEFEQLSDGFKSVMTWVADLVARLADNQSNITKIQDFEGIVLVDEINLHLHPKWERNLVKKLRTWFPNIQFFFTTHSPTMLLSASKDAVFYKVYKENGQTNVSEPMPCEKFAGMMANNIITSSLFDLDNAFMEISQHETANLDTSENYLESKIRAILSKEKEKNNKKHFNESELDAILNDAFEKYKNGTL